MGKILTVNEGIHGLNLAEWHRRFTQQGKWTEDIRRHLFEKAQLDSTDKILEVGSGTGAILDLLREDSYKYLVGIDIDRQCLIYAKQNKSTYDLTQANGYHLPFPDDTFKLVYCHYLLLWLENPSAMLTEMQRVTQSGGCVIALAEPDHQARIDYPPPLDTLGNLQTQALEAQGVDVQLGRKLSWLFNEARFDEVETGILGAQWISEKTHSVDETEWLILRADLADNIPTEDFAVYLDKEERARQQGSRVLFIPTFYAMGRVNKPEG